MCMYVLFTLVCNAGVRVPKVATRKCIFVELLYLHETRAATESRCTGSSLGALFVVLAVFFIV